MQLTAIASVIGITGPAIAHGTNYDRSTDATGATTSDSATLNSAATTDESTSNAGIDNGMRRGQTIRGDSTLNGSSVTRSGNDDLNPDRDSNMSAGGVNGSSSIDGAPPAGNSYGSSTSIVNDGTPSGRQTSRYDAGPLRDPNRSLNEPMSDSERAKSGNAASNQPMSNSDLTTSPAAPNAR
jgi:hypothetical protein